MGFFSGGKTTSESFSGLRGTDQFKPLTGQLGSGFQFGMDTARQRVSDMNPLGLNDSGLTDAQMNAFNTLGKNLFSGVSSNFAGRGFLSPDNVTGVLGSSLTQAAPQLMNQVFQNQMGNQSVMSDRFGALRGLLDTGTGLAGQQTKTHSQTKGPDLLGQAMAGAIGKWASPDWMIDAAKAASSAGALCWVAEALYGKEDIRTFCARWYVNNILPQSFMGRVFYAVYKKYGQQIAKRVPTSSVLRALLTPLFDRFWTNGAQLLSR